MEQTSNNRKVIHTTCILHRGPVGFVNFAIRKVVTFSPSVSDYIELDPTVTGTCVIRLDEVAATQLFDLLGESLG